MRPATSESPSLAISRLAAETALVVLGFSLVTSFFLRPTAARVATHLCSELGDALFNLYVLQWVSHQWSLGLPDLWNAPFFFPEPAALTLSDHLVGPGLLFLVLERLGGPILAYNLLLMASFPLTAAATYWVLRRSDVSVFAAWLGAAALTFAPFRWMHLGHLQILFMPLTPLVLWTFDRLLREPRAHRAALFLLTYLPHLTGGCYLAYMTHIPMAVLAAWRFVRAPRDFLRPRVLAVLGTVALLATGALVALFLPYQRAAREGRERLPRQIAAYAATPASFLTASQRNRYQPADLVPNGDASRTDRALFPGLVAALLAPLGLTIWLRARRAPLWQSTGDEAGPWRTGLLFASGAALLLSFGGPYLLAAHLLPGLSGMRAPARFVAVAWPGLALLVALGFDALALRIAPPGARRSAWAKPLWGALALGSILLLEAPRQIHWARLETPAEIPAIHHWLATAEANDVRALLELPLRRDGRATLAMHRATVHWRPIANGYSGYRPRSALRLGESFTRFPEAPAFAILRRQGITHVLAPRLRGREPWEREFLGREIELTRSEGGWRLYRVLPTPPVAVQAEG